MDLEEYKAQFEDIADDFDITIKPNRLNLLAARAIQLQSDVLLSLDDIYDELFELVPDSVRDSDEWVDLIQEIANLVFDEKENGDIDEDSDDE